MGCTTKSFEIEFRQIIGFSNPYATQIAKPNFLNFVSVKFIVLPIFILPTTIRDYLKGSRNIQGFAVVRSVWFIIRLVCFLLAYSSTSIVK